MAEKFWIKKNRNQQDVSRDLGNNSYNAGPYHTIRQPQDLKAYDPWADWFNAGLDPEPFTDNFYVEPEESKPPLFFEESPDHSAPWFTPQEQQQYQAEQETPQAQEQQGYPGEHQYYDYQGFLGYQDNLDQRPAEDEPTSDFIDAHFAVSEGEPSAQADQNREKNQEEVAVSPLNKEQQESETAEIEKIDPEEEAMVERAKALETDKDKAFLNNQEPLVWRNFPEKSC